jgi:hypothetical protein
LSEAGTRFGGVSRICPGRAVRFCDGRRRF